MPGKWSITALCDLSYLGETPVVGALSSALMRFESQLKKHSSDLGGQPFVREAQIAISGLFEVSENVGTIEIIR